MSVSNTCINVKKKNLIYSDNRSVSGCGQGYLEKTDYKEVCGNIFGGRKCSVP